MTQVLDSAWQVDIDLLGFGMGGHRQPSCRGSAQKLTHCPCQSRQTGSMDAVPTFAHFIFEEPTNPTVHVSTFSSNTSKATGTSLCLPCRCTPPPISVFEPPVRTYVRVSTNLPFSDDELLLTTFVAHNLFTAVFLSLLLLQVRMVAAPFETMAQGSRGAALIYDLHMQ